jgi:HEAT repeat protein
VKKCVVLGFALFIAACSNVGGLQAVHPGPVTLPGGDVKGSQVVRDSYSYSEGGLCNTGDHTFVFSTHADLDKAECEALQDEDLNKNCALIWRKQKFYQQCSGRFVSKYRTPHVDIPDNVTASGVRTDLENLFAQSITVNPELSGDLKDAAATLAADMDLCGFGPNGPHCLNRRGSSLGGKLQGVDSKPALQDAVRINGIQDDLLITFFLSQMQPKAKSEKVVVSRKSDQTVLLTIVPAADTLVEAWKRTERPRDGRDFLHAGLTILDMPLIGYTTSKLKTAFEKNSQVLAKTSDPKYLSRIFDLARTLGVNQQVVLDMAEAMVLSSSLDVQMMGAVEILKVQPGRTELKALALKGLGSGTWTIRRDAIVGLSLTKMTSDEENAVLARIADSDADVRTAAIQAAAKMQLDEQNLSTLEDLQKSGSWDARKQATALLGGIDSPAATADLIARMADSDNEVRNEVMKQLANKPLSAKNVPDLAKQQSSSSWTVRKSAAQLLGKIKDATATKELIAHMDDSDDDVRSEVMRQLSSRALSALSIPDLAKKFSSTSYSVRRNVAVLLGSIDDAAATKELIAHIDDADDDVRNAVDGQLEDGQLTAAMVAPLKGKFNSNAWSVRAEVAKLLGRIKSSDARSALRERLKVEKDSDVKDAIQEALKA